MENKLLLDVMVEIVDVQLKDLFKELQTMQFLTKPDVDLLYLQPQKLNDCCRLPCNANMMKKKLYLSLVVVGLYPNIAFILKPPKTFVEMSGGSITRENEAGEYK